MENVQFLPYIGKHYEKGFCGKKLLVLGESHYDDDEHSHSEFTRDVVKDFLAYQIGEKAHSDWMNTHTKFVKAFFYGNSDNVNIVDFYEHIAFYNYVQTFVADTRQAPTKEQFEQSEKAFFEVLEELQPDIIVAWGYRLWDNMTADKVKYDEPNDDYYYVLDSGKEVLIIGVIHPSAPIFSYKGAYAVLKEYFNI